MSIKQNINEYSLFLINKACYFPVIFFIPVFLEDKGIMGWQVGFLMGEIYLSGLLLTLPAGILNDRIESKRIILLSLFLSGLSLLLLSLSKSFLILIAIFFIFGISRSMFQVSFDALFFKQIIRGRGAVHVGRYELVFSLSAIIGLSLAGLLFNGVSFQLFYGGIGFIYFLSMVIAVRLGISGTSVIPLREYRKGIIKPELAALAVILFLFSMHWGAEDTCYGLFLKHYLNASRGWSSLYMMTEFIVLGGSAYSVSRMVDRFGLNLRWLFAFGILISGVFLILQINTDFTLSMFMRMLHGFGDGIVMLVVYFGISRVFEIEKIGGSISFVTTVLISGSFAGSMIFSRFGRVYGYQYSFIICGIILIITSLLLILYNSYLRMRKSLAVKRGG